MAAERRQLLLAGILSYTSKGHKFGPNRYLCAKICMIWSATTEREYKYDQMNSTHLDSHSNMVVVGKYAKIIHWAVNIADVRPFSSDCSKLEAVQIVDAVVAYDYPHIL